MKKRTKTISLAILACLVALALAACGADPASAGGNDAGNAGFSAPGEFPIVEEPVILKFWTTYSAMIADMATNTLNTGIQDITNVIIDWEMVPAEEKDTKFSLSLASKDYPDAWATRLTTDQVLMGVEAGAFLPLNDLIEQHAPNTQEIFDALPEYKEGFTAPDGNIYTFMNASCAVHVISPYKMFVNDEWLQAYGELPQTTEDFRAMLEYFRDNDMNGNGNNSDEIPLVSAKDAWNGNPMLYLMNGFQLYSPNYYLVNDAGQVEFIADTEGWKAGLEYLHGLYADGLIAVETYIQDNTQLKALVNKEDPADRIVGAVSAAYQGVFVDSGVMEWLDYSPVPPLEGPTGMRQSYATTSFSPSDVISTNCEYPEIAVKWMDYWMSEEGAIANFYGMVEGTDYERVDIPAFNGESTSIKPLQDRLSPTANYLFGDGILPVFDTPASRYATSDDPAQRNIDNTYMLVSAAEVYEPYYVYDKVPVLMWASDNDWMLKKAELKTFVDESATKFVVGELDIETGWEDYLAELEAMGLSEYMAQTAQLLGL